MMKKILPLLLLTVILISSCSVFEVPRVRFRNNMLDNQTIQGLQFDGAIYDKNLYVGTSTKYLDVDSGSGYVSYLSGGTWHTISDKITLDWGDHTIFISGTIGDFSCTAQKDK